MLAAAGAALVVVNGSTPDESRWLGAALVALGAWGVVVPRGRAVGSTARIRPPSRSTRVPSPGAIAVVSSTLATAAIVASASPRKPRVATCSS